MTHYRESSTSSSSQGLCWLDASPRTFKFRFESKSVTLFASSMSCQGPLLKAHRRAQHHPALGVGAAETDPPMAVWNGHAGQLRTGEVVTLPHVASDCFV
mmetsp:Transcript_72982/g.152388  ORF Transcript_72982/g.152388 Transcript_72982/m.152388 type:complete len:100 (+) Transcript_72982:216-515(+)